MLSNAFANNCFSHKPTRRFWRENSYHKISLRRFCLYSKYLVPAGSIICSSPSSRFVAIPINTRSSISPVPLITKEWVAIYRTTPLIPDCSTWVASTSAP